MHCIKVRLPFHLKNLAKTDSEIELKVEGSPTIERVLDMLEESYPALKGAIRDQTTRERRPFLRFFVCGEDWSHGMSATELPQAILSGQEPLLIVGAIAGG